MALTFGGGTLPLSEDGKESSAVMHELKAMSIAGELLRTRELPLLKGIDQHDGLYCGPEGLIKASQCMWRSL